MENVSDTDLNIPIPIFQEILLNQLQLDQVGDNCSITIYEIEWINEWNLSEYWLIIKRIINTLLTI